MRTVKLILTLAVGLLVLLLGVLFAIRNTAKVSIDLIWVELPEASLSLWLIGFFVAGTLLGSLMTGARSLLLSARLSRTSRKQRKAEEQLKRLQQSG
ncbi:MAG TPA: LapA family protein [Marinobacterium sp.]|nr:LapA family protein [Marinobacterium sp.]